MNKRCKPLCKVFGGVFLLLAVTHPGYAQLGIGGGFEYGTAVFTNKEIFVGKPSLGFSAMLSYAPRKSKLFPSVTYLLKNMVVPVNNSYYSQQNDIARGHNFALNLNYRTSTYEPNYYQLFMGIGIAKISPEVNLSDKQGNALTLIDTTSVSLYPMVQVGCKYMYRILSNSSFYIGVEANLKYIRMHSADVDYLQQGSNIVKASIGGEIICPGIQVHLDYIFDGNEE